MRRALYRSENQLTNVVSYVRKQACDKDIRDGRSREGKTS